MTDKQLERGNEMKFYRKWWIWVFFRNAYQYWLGAKPVYDYSIVDPLGVILISKGEFKSVFK